MITKEVDIMPLQAGREGRRGGWHVITEHQAAARVESGRGDVSDCITPTKLL